MAVRKTSEKEHLQRLKYLWIEEGNEWPVPIHRIVQWALQNHHIQRSKQSEVQFWSRKMQAALRDEFYTDPQGRRPRVNHCFPRLIDTPSGEKQQQFLWCDIRNASPDEVRACFQHRRNKMVSEGVQLQTDVDSYNDNNKQGVKIQLVLDLTYDVEERRGGGEYDPS